VCCRTTRTLLPIHDRWVPKYVNWYCVIVCTFIYPFVVTNKIRYLFQATSYKTPASSAVSPGGQPARCNSAEGSHDALPVRLLPPQCASRPLEAGDPHVPLHRRQDDGDPSGHVASDGPFLWGRATKGRGQLAYGVPRSVRERSSERSHARPVPGVHKRSQTHIVLVAAF
jgi:hypothetical protein